MNRRHMTGDHHGQTAGRATLLVRAMDEILGTHTARLKIINHLVTAPNGGYARGREVLGKSRCVRPAHRGA